MVAFSAVQVEATAKALYALDPWAASLARKLVTGSPHWLWVDLPDEDRDHYRQQGRAVLAKALDPALFGVETLKSSYSFRRESSLYEEGRAAIVDEAKLAAVVRDVVDRRPYPEDTRRDIRGLENAVARAVAEWLRGGGR